jgi:hypothetical protein
MPIDDALDELVVDESSINVVKPEPKLELFTPKVIHNEDDLLDAVRGDLIKIEYDNNSEWTIYLGIDHSNDREELHPHSICSFIRIPKEKLPDQKFPVFTSYIKNLQFEGEFGNKVLFNYYHSNLGHITPGSEKHSRIKYSDIKELIDMYFDNRKIN